ncbi:MAG: DUF3027 domain-containing protein [Propionibacteriaceae bacterium]|jgi:hypothetical protein|nr:DUF3027 domain-containing protein [Propionibacteriaceae bacterium]
MAVKTPKPDAVTLEAVDLARQAAIEAGGEDQVGEHLGAVMEGDRLVTHAFASLHPGYSGWYWAVTLVRASRAKIPTVSEVVLLPGDEALVAPAWVPWSQRVEPGDVAPGMLMPTPDNDPRLEPGYTAGADPKTPEEAIEIRAVVHELGLGRERVITQEGRSLAAERWLKTHGPSAPEAQRAPAPCSTCGYLIRLRGELGAEFGVCANNFAAADGHVVSIDHGCGAHSDVVDEHRGVELPVPVWDTISIDHSLFD